MVHRNGLKFGRIIITSLRPGQKFFITEVLKTKVRAVRFFGVGQLSNFVQSFPIKTVRLVIVRRKKSRNGRTRGIIASIGR